MTTNKSTATDIIKDEVKQPTAPAIVMQGNTPVALPDLSDPVAVQAFIAELAAKNAELEKKESARLKELSLQDKIDNEPRFGAFRNNLLLRRIKNPEEIAPAIDVFDLIEVSDLKRSGTKNDRTYVSNREFATFLTMKAEGIINITYPMLVERMKSKSATGAEELTEPEAGDVTDDSATE